MKQSRVEPARTEGRDLTGRVGHLFDVIPHPGTDAIPDPKVGQVAAPAAVFGVEPSYLVDRKEPP